MRFQPPPGFQPIYNPVLPYSGPIYGGLKPGMYLSFQGTVSKDATRFRINLETGLEGSCDIALHFNPRFMNGDMVVMNTKEGGGWGSEERPSEMPFRKGESFQLLISVTPEGYQTKVNGNNFYLYKHRFPEGRVCALSIDGDVTLQVISINGGGKGHILGHPGLGQMVSVPYVGPIYGGLKTGMSVRIHGATPPDVTRFHVSLQTAEAKCSDRALYINPRFRPAESVVFNSFRNGIFEEQERRTDMPFTLGDNFELVITATDQGYQVNVDGCEYHMFPHRMPLASVLALAIAGDVLVQSINITGGGQGEIEAWPGPGYIGSDTYKQPIPGGLKEGMSLYLRGAVPAQDVHRFQVNLEGGGDLAIHCNPRFGGWSGVVFNTKQNGGWHRAENVDEMPFRKGDVFELVFFVTSEGYQVSVGGRQVLMYKHRVPLEQVTDLVIGGDVSVKTISIIRDEKDKPESPAPEEAQGIIQEYPGPGDVSSSGYNQSIEGGLQAGTTLYFQGTVHSEINRFHINLKGENEIAMHFKVNFIYVELLAFNTCTKAGWGIEERFDLMPFSKGQNFDLLINVTLTGYQVIVDGSLIHTYRHRIPLYRVNTLEVGGNVSVQNIVIIRGNTGGEGGEKLGYNWRFLPMMGTQPIYNPPNPYECVIPGGMTLNKTIVFSGKVLPDANWFAFNLEVGSNGDIAFHFNPRQNQGSVVRNSCLRGAWGKEEKDIKFNPFQKGRHVEILVHCKREKFMIFVNGKHTLDYFHRLQPFTKIDTLKIYGDIQLSCILI